MSLSALSNNAVRCSGASSERMCKDMAVDMDWFRECVSIFRKISKTCDFVEQLKLPRWQRRLNGPRQLARSEE